jgi:hypothetical protein
LYTWAVHRKGERRDWLRLVGLVCFFDRNSDSVLVWTRQLRDTEFCVCLLLRLRMLATRRRGPKIAYTHNRPLILPSVHDCSKATAIRDSIISWPDWGLALGTIAGSLTKRLLEWVGIPPADWLLPAFRSTAEWREV